MCSTADNILLMTEPGELFAGKSDTIKTEYHNLLKKYHPDLHNNSVKYRDVASKITVLYNMGLESLDKGIWKKPNMLELHSTNGKAFSIKYRTESVFELGKTYISDTVITYVIDKCNKGLFDKAVKALENFKYADSKMESAISIYLPKVKCTFETLDGDLVLVLDKTEDVFCLRDILLYFDGAIPDKHVAWILSGLYNIACYLEYSSTTHNSITLDTCFISSQYHSVCLFGGWWYSVKEGKKMFGVPTDIFNIMPPKVKTSKIGNIQTDLESIKLIGRQLLGDKNGTRLLSDKLAPQPLIQWLLESSSKSAFAENDNWSGILEKSYGKRKFIKLDIDKEVLYKKLKNKNI